LTLGIQRCLALLAVRHWLAEALAFTVQCVRKP